MQTIRIIVSILVLSLVSPIIFGANLDSVSIQSNASDTFIDCRIKGVFSHKTFILHNPERLIIDLSQTTTSLNPRNLSLDKRLMKSLRLGNPTPRVLRMVFDLKQPIRIKHSSLAVMSANLQRLRIDVVPIAATQLSKPSTTAVIKSPPRPSRSKDIIIVLDPGHGGKDPGARGPRRSYEKDVVLAIALRLKQLIDNQPGMHAVMTRHGDYYLGLRQRLHIARQQNADLFVSIHADAFINQHSNGASVFALSPNGATSEAARWLAEKENYSELGGVDLSELNDQNGLIRTVLIDLSQTATISASLRVGSRVLGYLNKMTTLHTGRVEQARFVVLKSPDIPSILVETGFISNPREESNLTNSAYQRKLAEALLQGIKTYFAEYPPHGTRMEAMSSLPFAVRHS